MARKHGRLFFITIAAALVVLLFQHGGCNTAMNDATIARVVASDVRKQLSGKRASGTILVDARQREAFEAGHLPGAINLRLEDVAAGGATKVQGFSTIIVYGQHPGEASAMAMVKRLTSLGHEDVRLFEGGYEAWRAAGLPVERGQHKPAHTRP